MPVVVAGAAAVNRRHNRVRGGALRLVYICIYSCWIRYDRRQVRCSTLFLSFLHSNVFIYFYLYPFLQCALKLLSWLALTSPVTARESQ